MGEPRTADLTMLIEASSAGDRQAQSELFTIVHDELRRIARRCRHVGAPGETLQATALVNEAYIELSRRMALARLESASVREAFYTTVARAMRTILRDYWRSRIAAKRGGGARVGSLPEGEGPGGTPSGFDAADFLALDESLQHLETFNPRWFQVVMHRYFAGREIEETAELMNISASTVKSDWQLARAWLRREMGIGAA